MSHSKAYLKHKCHYSYYCLCSLLMRLLFLRLNFFKFIAKLRWRYRDFLFTFHPHTCVPHHQCSPTRGVCLLQVMSLHWHIIPIWRLLHILCVWTNVAIIIVPYRMGSLLYKSRVLPALQGLLKLLSAPFFFKCISCKNWNTQRGTDFI